MPTKQEYTDLYAYGWINGLVASILEATSKTYFLVDPNEKKPVKKSDFSDYFQRLQQAARDANGGNLPAPFMNLSNVVVGEESNHGITTVWCRWEIPGFVAGAGMIAVGPNGVESEELFYSTPVPK